MPRKPTGPLHPLWSEQPDQAARKEHERRKRAYQKSNHRRDDEPLERRPEGPPSDFAEEVPEFSQESIPSRIQSFMPTSDPLRLSLWFAAFFLLFNASLRGWIPGLEAFATEASVRQFHEQYIDAKLDELKLAWCLGASPQLRHFYVKQIAKATRDYRDLMHRYPKSRTCKKLGVQEASVDAR